MQVNIDKRKEQLIIPYYYTNKSHKEKPYTDGLYGTLPAGVVKNFYAGDNRYCSNWMEWAYNNPYQPVSEYNEVLKKWMPFLDGSHANAVRNLGSLKTIWKEFERDYALLSQNLEDFDINWLEAEFWEYYISQYSDNFEKSVNILEDYVRNARARMTDDNRLKEKAKAPCFSDDKVWVSGCRDFLKHLIYTTPRGYMMELVLLASVCKLTGGYYEESSIYDERKGIDGYIVTNGQKVPISLKPATYNRQYLSPLDTTCFVTYQKRNTSYPHLVFDFVTGFESLGLHNVKKEG